MKSKDIRELIERQGYRCALTGRDLEPSVANLDHIIPLAKGGKHDISNCQVVHCAVNAAKGTMTNEEFIAMCHEVVAHQEQEQSSLYAPYEATI